jgi:hypothetical protein
MWVGAHFFLQKWILTPHFCCCKGHK